ncbi:MAG: hypothetical protein LQ351_003393 [Letrouitia transgressa]|nr:MAG: hypothetical protein LQ351_003393 [Letrouitia transgressa]
MEEHKSHTVDVERGGDGIRQLTPVSIINDSSAPKEGHESRSNLSNHNINSGETLERSLQPGSDDRWNFRVIYLDISKDGEYSYSMRILHEESLDQLKDSAPSDGIRLIIAEKRDRFLERDVESRRKLVDEKHIFKKSSDLAQFSVKDDPRMLYDTFYLRENYDITVFQRLLQFNCPKRFCALEFMDYDSEKVDLNFLWWQVRPDSLIGI